MVAAVNVAPSADNAIEVYLGNGDGSLQAPTSYATSLEGNAVTLADLNGDGILDLATVWYDLAVMFGNGDGTFAPPQTYIELPGADGILAVDMNGDGSPDLVELHADYSRPGPDAVAVWGNRGDGTFSKPALYATGHAPLALTVGDFNRDGRPDVLTANYYGESLSVLLSGGGRTLIGQRDYPVSHYDGGAAGAVALGYVDGDKNLDAVVVDNLGFRVFVLPGNPDGTFGAAQSHMIGDAGAAIALGDLNGDGALDIVTGNCFRSISVLLGDGKGRFKPHVEYTTDTEPHSVVLADVNNDGALDVLTGDYQGKSVSTLLNDGTGVFLPYIETHITDRVLSLAVGDLNKDGFVDFATANKPNGGISSFSIALGNGDGTFTVTQKTDTVSVASIAIADVNRDGNLDVVVFGDDQIAFYPATATALSANVVRVPPTRGQPQACSLISTATANLTQLRRPASSPATGMAPSNPCRLTLLWDTASSPRT